MEADKEYEKVKAEMVESLKAATVPEEEEDLDEGPEEAIKVYSSAEVLVALQIIARNMEDIFDEEWAMYDDWTEREIRYLENFLESMDFCIQSLTDWIGINRLRLETLHKKED